jgi:cell division protein FtsA
MANDGLIFGLDIGTTKTCAMIAEYNEKGQLEITGMGLCPSTGMKKGVIVNIEATVQAIRAAVEAAELMCGRELRNCWIGIGGNQIEGRNSRGVIAVTGKSKDNKDLREIGAADIERVLEAAQAIAIPMDRQILEVIPQSYIVDDQKGIRDPLNMIGVRLEAEVHIITCSVTSEQNLIKCVNGAKLVVNDVILKTLAAGKAVLTPEEKEMGVALIDMGGGTTDVLVYSEGAPYSNASIPAGGTNITSDIAKVKGISYEAADKIKLEAGCCWDDLLDIDDNIIVPGVGGRPPLPIPRSQLLAIIGPRVEETFMMVKDRIDKTVLARPLGGGIVLTGGGSLLNGAAELASHIFKLPVRVGSPLPMSGLVGEYRTPVLSTAIGLLLSGGERDSVIPDRIVERPRERKTANGPSLISRFITWLGNDFF